MHRKDIVLNIFSLIWKLVSVGYLSNLTALCNQTLQGHAAQNLVSVWAFGKKNVISGNVVFLSF